MKRMQMWLLRKWSWIRDLVRRLSGDDAYERYLVHYARAHADAENAPARMTRKEFYRALENRRWNGPNRCC